MPILKPWYTVATPREDLRKGRPLDASEFAVHLDQIRDGRAPSDYQTPERFFARTYLTQNLTTLAAEVLRRLSGERTETSAIFNMATQFGGGKTHALTLLYHLARHGPEAHRWLGVNQLLERAGVAAVPRAATAVFVGTEFDSLTGRGGDDGTPLRKTPWGEIAYQLGGPASLAVLAEHERQLTAPAGDVIRAFLPQERPCLILMDELMNYVSRSRKSGMATQLYNFIHTLSEEARGRNNVVVAVSIPASELEMSAEDQTDYDRFKKLLDRLGKAVMMSAESEAAEIIRRRLFEWDESAVPQDGKVRLSREALHTCRGYARWIIDHRHYIPNWFPIDHAQAAFAATYPFHPMVFSVFERKWQALPRFQRTRGVLRLLALWVSKDYHEGYTGAHRDPLISLGTAPLDDPMFRAALFEQLGEPRFEGVVTTDICGKQDAHAVRLDTKPAEAIKKARLHRKVATTIFFESNGAQARTEATVPEIRLAVAEPGLDMGNTETVLEALGATCYYLRVERNGYRFSLTPNLNKILSDRRASIQPARIEQRVRDEILQVFKRGESVERISFPERSNQIPDRAALTFVIVSPDQTVPDMSQTARWVDTMTREYGASARIFKSALIWCIPDMTSLLYDDARKLLAWEDIQNEEDALRLDEGQKRQLTQNLQRAQRDLEESVWRTYKNLMLLDKNNTMRVVDLGLVHSSAAHSLVTLILNRLRQDGDVESIIHPNYLVRHWPALKEWSMKAVRDAFFASPQFPRLLNADVLKDTIARGVASGVLAYVGKTTGSAYEPFFYGMALSPSDVEFSDDTFLITRETAEDYKRRQEAQIPVTAAITNATYTGQNEPEPTVAEALSLRPAEIPHHTGVAKLTWTGEVPPQKWMNFYTRILARFATDQGLKLILRVEVAPDGGVSAQKIEETKVALRELGLQDEVETSNKT